MQTARQGTVFSIPRICAQVQLWREHNRLQAQPAKLTHGTAIGHIQPEPAIEREPIRIPARRNAVNQKRLKSQTPARLSDLLRTSDSCRPVQSQAAQSQSVAAQADTPLAPEAAGALAHKFFQTGISLRLELFVLQYRGPQAGVRQRPAGLFCSGNSSGGLTTRHAGCCRASCQSASPLPPQRVDLFGSAKRLPLYRYICHVYVKRGSPRFGKLTDQYFLGYWFLFGRLQDFRPLCAGQCSRCTGAPLPAGFLSAAAGLLSPAACAALLSAPEFDAVCPPFF